jgi:hypothetical protein
MHHHRRAERQRPAENGGGGVVHDQRHAELAAKRRHFRDREDLQLRVRQRLGIPAAGAVVGRVDKGLRVRRVHEADLDAEGFEGVGEQVPGAAIEVGGGDDVVPGLAQVQHAEARRRLAGPQREAGHAAFQRRDALFQHVHGGVHDAGVDVAHLGQAEQALSVAGVLELEGGGLVDRHRHRTRGRVGTPAGVQRNGFRLFRCGHGAVLLIPDAFPGAHPFHAPGAIGKGEAVPPGFMGETADVSPVSSAAAKACPVGRGARPDPRYGGGSFGSPHGMVIRGP